MVPIVAEFPVCFEPNLNGESILKRFSLVKVKESENIALTLHCVQPQEYIEYFED